MKKLFPAIVAILLLAGCMASTSRLNQISVGMTKQEVASALGDPIIKAAQGNGEVYRYHLRTPEQMMLTGGHDEYYVRFVGDRVESFGRFGDFDSVKNPTVEIRSESRSDSKVKVDSSGDLYTELMKLSELRKQGILTDAEFEAQKKKLLERK